MEDTLRGYYKRSCGTKWKVLILVLMEDTLRALTFYTLQNEKEVLILVLMEDTLRVHLPQRITMTILRLNPCFNGRYSQRLAN